VILEVEQYDTPPPSDIVDEVRWVEGLFGVRLLTPVSLKNLHSTGFVTLNIDKRTTVQQKKHSSRKAVREIVLRITYGAYHLVEMVASQKPATLTEPSEANAVPCAVDSA